MELELTSDQVMLRDTLRRYVAEQVVPNVRAWDRDGTFPRQVVGELAEMGMLGVEVAADHGGSDLGAIEMALVVEELARGDGGLAMTVAAHNGLCIGHLRLFGSDEQRSRLLPRLATGEALGAWSLTEPSSSPADSSLVATAERDGDAWVLNGTKQYVTNGGVAELIVIFAVTDPNARSAGITAFAVPADASGLSRRPGGEKLGARSADTAILQLDGVRVPDSDRLGEVGQGFTDALRLLERARINVGAIALGLGAGALEAARNYARERKQFGKLIGEFQAIQWKLADSATELEAARLLVYRAAWLCDTGQSFAREASMAKLFASEAVMRITDHAIQIHGGMGYTTEFPVERYYRDAKLCALAEGTSEIQRTLIARSVLSEAG